MVGEQHALKGREIVEELLRRQALDLRMIDQRAERLLLQRRHAGIELVSTGVVRASGPRVDAVRSRELHVIDGRNRAPDVDERLGRRGVGAGIDQLDVRRQRECDPDETVLAEIAEVAGALAVDPEIIRVYRPEQRIVGVRIPSAAQFEKSEPGLDIRRRELEMARRHVAVGAGAPVRAQTVKPAVEERAVARGRRRRTVRRRSRLAPAAIRLRAQTPRPLGRTENCRPGSPA